MIIQKPHTWIELNKTAFDHNIAIYKNLLPANTHLSIVIKSNAYGHGTKEIAQFCQQNSSVDWMCTATLSDALYIRSLGINKPIIVLSIIDEAPELAIINDIDLPVFDFETLHQLNKAAQNVGKKINLHIKIDTGMSRFGFLVDQGLHAIKDALQLSNINIRGIFTHCAEAGNSDTSFTVQQLEQFNTLCSQLEQSGIHIPFRHASNSGVASTVNQYFPHLNFVRIGAGAYGLWHFKQTQNQIESTNPISLLRSILTWKTRVSYVKNIPAKTYVGYDRTYQTAQPTTLAIIPIGYYEGYDRRFTNSGIVIINDYYARVVGRVCMNATILAIPSDKKVATGDEVMLLGEYDHIRAHDLCTIIGSFNAREITTRLSPTIDRVIIEQDYRHEIVNIHENKIEVATIK
jgi:alanine racemase